MQPQMVAYDADGLSQAIQDVRDGRLAAYVSDFTEVLYYAQVGTGATRGLNPFDVKWGGGNDGRGWKPF